MNLFEVTLEKDDELLCVAKVKAKTEEDAKQITISCERICSTCEGYVDDEGLGSTANCGYSSSCCEECKSCNCDGAC